MASSQSFLVEQLDDFCDVTKLTDGHLQDKLCRHSCYTVQVGSIQVCSENIIMDIILAYQLQVDRYAMLM